MTDKKILEVASEVLRRTGSSLYYRDIADMALDEKLIESQKPLWPWILCAISRDIRKYGETSLFANANQPGYFRLRTNGLWN